METSRTEGLVGVAMHVLSIVLVVLGCQCRDDAYLGYCRVFRRPAKNIARPENPTKRENTAKCLSGTPVPKISPVALLRLYIKPCPSLHPPDTKIKPRRKANTATPQNQSPRSDRPRPQCHFQRRRSAFMVSLCFRPTSKVVARRRRTYRAKRTRELVRRCHPRLVG